MDISVETLRKIPTLSKFSDNETRDCKPLKKYRNNQYPYLTLLRGWALIRVCALKSTFSEWGGGGGRLFEAGRLLIFSTSGVGAYSRWTLIRGWALNRINTVFESLAQARCGRDMVL